MELIPEVASDVVESNVGRIVKLLRGLLHKNKQPAQEGTSGAAEAAPGATVPKNMPRATPATQAADGAYHQDGLSDPGLMDPVTGSGFGPEIKF